MPSWLEKPSEFNLLAEAFGPSADFMDSYRAAIQSLSDPATGLAELAAASSRIDAPAENHFAAHWLSEWWPTLQPIEPKLRAGVLAAIKHAEAVRLPMDLLWVCAGPASGPDVFEIGFAESAVQVTLIIATSAPPGVQVPGPPRPTWTIQGDGLQAVHAGEDS